MRALVIALLLMGMLAAEEVTDLSEILNARYAHVRCKVDFTTSTLQAVSTSVPQASAELSPHISKLSDDVTELRSLTDAGNVSNFNAYIAGTVNQDVRAAHQALQAQRAHYREYNVTRDVLVSLKREFNASRQEFVECQRDAAKELGEARVEQFNAALARWRNSSAGLAAKGVDVTEMDAVIDEAQANIVAPLSAVVNSDDPEQIEAALKAYCLGNLCRNGTNGHYYAKFHIARLKAVLAKVQAYPEAANHTDDISEINTHILAAETELSSVGTAQYSEAQRTSVWSHIKEATQVLRDLIGHNNEERGD